MVPFTREIKTNERLARPICKMLLKMGSTNISSASIPLANGVLYFF